MPTTIQITTDSFDGQTAVITYYPDTGGTINLGTHVLPYDYNSNYYYGTYSLYFPAFDTTCTLVIANQTPTPTTTNTPTPTVTPTMTPTPSSSSPKNYYIYKLCSDVVIQYVVQTEPGLTITPGKVIRDGIDTFECYEFISITTVFPSYPPGTTILNITGNYFTNTLNTEFNNCIDCNYVAPLPRCTTVIFTVGGINPLCNDGLPAYGHAAVEWTDCDGNPQTHTFGGSSPGTQYQVCALTNGNSNISPTQPIPDFICGYGTVTDTGGECVNCYSYTINGPRSLTYLNCSGISTTVNVPAGDSLSICSKYRGEVSDGYC
jgi:hypothetical protein